MSVEGQEGFRHGRMRRKREREKASPTKNGEQRSGGGRMMRMKMIGGDVKKCRKCHT